MSECNRIPDIAGELFPMVCCDVNEMLLIIGYVLKKQ
jgi:hypothetical protein